MFLKYTKRKDYLRLYLIKKNELPYGRDVVDKNYLNECGYFYWDRDTCLIENVGIKENINNCRN